MIPANTFVVFGPERAPEVHFIDLRSAELFNQRESVSSRSKAVEATFGKGFRYALPAWVSDCMEQFALSYSGIFERELKALCAAIALGEPTSLDADWRNGKPPSGGDRVKVTPKKPAPRGPVSAKVRSYSKVS